MSIYSHGSDAGGFFKDNILVAELWDIVAGKRLGNGIARDVYVFAPDPTLVIKIETASRRFQNVNEWTIWDRVQHFKPLAHWFAPCVAISCSGGVMLQKRVNPADDAALPDRIPAFFSDNKRANWGVFEGRPVCCDYGSHTMLENGMTRRMKKADWWE